MFKMILLSSCSNQPLQECKFLLYLTAKISPRKLGRQQQHLSFKIQCFLSFPFPSIFIFFRQAEFELTTYHLPSLASQLVRMQVWATTPGSENSHLVKLDPINQ